MDPRKSQNYFKLAYILLEIVPKHLRELAKVEWDTRYTSTPWNDDEPSRLNLKNEERSGQNWRRNKQNIPKSGDRNDWDPTTLFFVLLYSRAINLPKTSSLYPHIDRLREIRNKHFGHVKDTSLDTADFETLYSDIEACMKGLNGPAVLMKQMKDIKTGSTPLTDADVHRLLKMVLEMQENHQKFLSKIKQIVGLIIIATFMVLFCTAVFMHLTKTQSNFQTYFPDSKKPHYYVGHAHEIATASNLLVNGTYQIVSLTSAPALGKTATAIAIGQSLKEHHWFNVAFIDLKELNASSTCHYKLQLMNHTMISLGGEPLEKVITTMEFVSMVKKLITGTTLLIFDTVESVLGSDAGQTFKDVIQDCLGIGEIRILTTSRTHFDLIGVSKYEIILEPLSDDESSHLLHNIHPELSSRSRLAIAKKIGGIPLLLEVIGSQLKHGVYDEEELLLELEEKPLLVIVNNTDDFTISKNYFKLLKTLFDGLDPNLQDIFIALSTISKSFNQDTANVVVNFNQRKKIKLYRLVQYRLIKEFKSATGQRMYEMHSVFCEVASLVANENPRQSLRKYTSSVIFCDFQIWQMLAFERFWLEVALCPTMVDSGPQCVDSDFFSKFQRLNNSFHIDLHLQRIAHQFSMSNSIFQVKNLHDTDFYDNYRNIQENALQFAHQIAQENKAAVSALIASLQNLPNSLRHYSMTQFDEYPSKFEISTARMMHIIGMVWYEHGFHKESLGMLNKALNLMGHDAYKSSIIMIHTAFAQYQLGDLQEASDTLYQAVYTLIQPGVLKPMDGHTKIIANTYDISDDEIYDYMLTSNAAIIGAILLESLHSHKKSIDMLEAAYAIDQKLLGNHIKTSLTLLNIAHAYSKLGNKNKTLEYKMRNAVREVSKNGVFHFLLPGNHPDKVHLERILCGIDALDHDNTMISWKFDVASELATTKRPFLKPNQMSYRLHHTIVDQNKLWNDEFDFLIKETGDTQSLNLPQELLNITLLASPENILNNECGRGIKEHHDNVIYEYDLRVKIRVRVSD
ncbi:uncharacterized protein [Amphiura filiformis]|uniref:uncharacterized protein n=1 Tax=Amphiura filiformis TaxID=82378 RepID=UPI003B2183E2